MSTATVEITRAFIETGIDGAGMEAAAARFAELGRRTLEPLASVYPTKSGEVGLRSDDPSEPLSWQAEGLCAQTDPEAFFPEKGGSTRDAKRVCGECAVRGACLAYALSHDERFGIWGGLSERERRPLKRRV